MNLMWTPEIEEKLRNPKPGSKLEAAIKADVDIEKMIENLKLTPEERIEKLQREMYALEEFEKKSREEE